MTTDGPTAIDILTSYEEHLVTDGKGDKTVSSYIGDIRIFLEWLETKDIDFTVKLTRFYITSYKEELIEKGYTINTINKKINSLNSFNQYLIEEKLFNEKVAYPKKDKIKIARGSESEVEVFTDDEVERILFYLENREQVSLRDRTPILTLLYTGLRVSELVSIKIKDIDLLTLNLKVVGKGDKYREVPLKAEAAQAMKDYLDNERRDSRFADSNTYY